MYNPGLVSLSGFAFQIRAFIYYLSQLEIDESVNYEILEDVSVTHKNIDSTDSDLKIRESTSTKAIQVKKANLTKEQMGKVIKNWLILEYESIPISEYHLVLEGKISGDLFDQTIIDSVYEQITSDKKKNSDGKKRSDSLESRLKKFIIDENEFKNTINSIKSKYKLINSDLEQEIIKGFDKEFRRSHNEVVFKNRMEELFQKVTYEIIEKANKRESYVMTYNDFINLIEEITLTHTETRSEPSYSNFKKLHPIDLADETIKTSRQYLQLIECKLTVGQLKRQLTYGLYFNSAYLLNMECSSFKLYNDILLTSFENFEDVLGEIGDEDTPQKRLQNSQTKRNDYAPNQQIGYGSYIFLTRDEEQEMRISWKDD